MTNKNHPLPFDAYPGGGRSLLGRVKGANCRHEYGLQFLRMTGATHCAYCGLHVTDAYENWLQMALDHVVPTSVGLCLGLPSEWVDDSANKVLSCAACNTFGNRYKTPSTTICPTTLVEFFDLRDSIFIERKALIMQRHASERAFFALRPWEETSAKSWPK